MGKGFTFFFCVCDPSQKISRIERDTNVIYTHTHTWNCVHSIVFAKLFIFFYLWACCSCFVICFPSFSFPRSTSRRLLFSFILQSYRSIRSGLDTSNRRGVSRIFSLSYPLIKRRKHKERRRKIEKEVQNEISIRTLLPIILERLSWAGYLDSLTLLHHDAISIHLASTR